MIMLTVAFVDGVLLYREKIIRNLAGLSNMRICNCMRYKSRSIILLY